MYRLLIILVSSFFAFTGYPGLVAAESEAIVIQARKFPDGGFQKIRATDRILRTLSDTEDSI